VTGWTFLGTEVATKLVEILKQAAPSISRQHGFGIPPIRRP
jgi:hypothetical protein